MDILKPISPVIPVFFLIGIGFSFARWKRISLEPITDLIVYLTAPALVFTSIASKTLQPADILMMIIGAAGIIAGVAFLIWIYFVLFRFHSRGFILPVLFMNAGNMGLPLALFALGDPGLQRATILYVIISFLQGSLGIYIVSHERGWREIFRLPLIYATLLGIFFNFSGITIPFPIFEPLRILGHSSIPLMLLSLGFRLRDIRGITWGHSLGGALLRIFGGLAAAAATVYFLGFEGINRQVILLYGALPSAVVNFVLTEKYRQDPELAASIIVIGTLLSVFTIPLLFWIIL